MVLLFRRRCLVRALDSLDVGCGRTPKGEVNCDLYPQPTSHRNSKMNLKLTKNFVRCDAQHLPFKSNMFKKVYCYHTLEHLKAPCKAIKEFIRVSFNRVFIRVPYRNNIPFRFIQTLRGHPGPNRSHLWSFTKTWFIRFAQTYGFLVEVDYIDFWVIPTELEATFFSCGVQPSKG